MDKPIINTNITKTTLDKAIEKIVIPSIKTPKMPATIEINCIDCGTARTINRGEAFQVKRCAGCQEKHRKQLRKGYRKNRLSVLKARVKQLEDLLTENHLGIPA